jgi:hypothetical protein
MKLLLQLQKKLQQAEKEKVIKDKQVLKDELAYEGTDIKSEVKKNLR